MPKNMQLSVNFQFQYFGSVINCMKYNVNKIFNCKFQFFQLFFHLKTLKYSMSMNPLGVRHLQCFLLFLGFSIAYALRVNLSLAIVAMTDKNHTNPDFEEYQWPEATKSLILSSFFWGYVMTQIPGGQLSCLFGGKIIFLCGILICSVLGTLTPLSTDIGGWKWLCGLRVLQGLSQGVIFPAAHTILCKWAPVDERGTLTTYSYAGMEFGTVIMFSSSGILASSKLGWPSIFYISGAVGIVWALAFYIWGASTPDDYKSITVAEKELIATSHGVEACEAHIKLKTPWARILTSMPFLVLTLSHCANNWGFYTLLIEIPTYIKNILGMKIERNALFSALPCLAMLVLSIVFSNLARELGKRELISLSTNRKLFNTIGQWIPMISLVSLGFIGIAQTTFAIILLTITMGANSAVFVGFQVNHMDLSPNFAGILMGISNCAANVMGILAPLTVGLIVTDEKNPDLWRIVFFIASGIFFIGNLMFILFGKTKIQPWNNSQRQSE